MRATLVIAGAAVIVVGLVVFAFGVIGVGQATTDFVNCLNGVPMQPTFGFPSACANAMNAVASWEIVEAFGGFLGVLGLVLLAVGILLDRERPAPIYPQAYPPPYGPPPAYMPTEGPQVPPPPP